MPEVIHTRIKSREGVAPPPAKPGPESGKSRRPHQPKPQESHKPLSKGQPHPGYLEKGPLITEDMFNKANWPEILDIPKSSKPTQNQGPLRRSERLRKTKQEPSTLELSSVVKPPPGFENSPYPMNPLFL